eukprot:scaffold26532_cov56-Attheya_sp.AAC.1
MGSFETHHKSSSLSGVKDPAQKGRSTMGVPVGMPPWAVLLSVLLLAWIRVTLVSAVVNGEVGLKVSIIENGLRMAPSCQRTVSQIELTNL